MAGSGPEPRPAPAVSGSAIAAAGSAAGIHEPRPGRRGVSTLRRARAALDPVRVPGSKPARRWLYTLRGGGAGVDCCSASLGRSCSGMLSAVASTGRCDWYRGGEAGGLGPHPCGPQSPGASTTSIRRRASRIVASHRRVSPARTARSSAGSPTRPSNPAPAAVATSPAPEAHRARGSRARPSASSSAPTRPSESRGSACGPGHALASGQRRLATATGRCGAGGRKCGAEPQWNPKQAPLARVRDRRLAEGMGPSRRTEGAGRREGDPAKHRKGGPPGPRDGLYLEEVPQPARQLVLQPRPRRRDAVSAALSATAVSASRARAGPARAASAPPAG